MGCHACYNVCPVDCIKMKSDDEGFWYPEVDHDKCINCHRCIDVCPIVNKPDKNSKPISYACISNDDDIRANSSSGGIFTLLAENTLAEHGVVYGASLTDDAEVVHVPVDDVAGINVLRGSKYVQSRIGDTYKQAKKHLLEGSQVLFSGTPCQIAGLRSYLGKDYPNLITVDIVCHGVPSPKVWKKYVDEQQMRYGSEAKEILFRDKSQGWNNFSMRIKFLNSEEYNKTLREDIFLRTFLKDVCLRPSCYACEFKSVERYSDITLADFWGVKRLLPDMDDDKGTSLVLVNSGKGHTIFKSLSDKLRSVEVDVYQALTYNPAAIRSANRNPNRDNFMRDLESLDMDKLYKLYCYDSIDIRVKNLIRSTISKIVKKFGLVS